MNIQNYVKYKNKRKQAPDYGKAQVEPIGRLERASSTGNRIMEVRLFMDNLLKNIVCSFQKSHKNKRLGINKDSNPLGIGYTGPARKYGYYKSIKKVKSKDRIPFKTADDYISPSNQGAYQSYSIDDDNSSKFYSWGSKQRPKGSVRYTTPGRTNWSRNYWNRKKGDNDSNWGRGGGWAAKNVNMPNTADKGQVIDPQRLSATTNNLNILSSIMQSFHKSKVYGCLSKKSAHGNEKSKRKMNRLIITDNK